MAFNLLGMFQPQPSQMQTLLGEYYDPKAARMAWLGGALQAAGAGLASGRPGAWAEGLALGGGQGNENYRRRALVEYGIKNQQDQQAKEDKRYDDEWAFRKSQAEDARTRQAKIDARQERIDGYAIADRNRLEAQRQAQEGYVTDWMGDQQQAGAGLPMSPGVRAIGRAGGVTGPSATDQWRFNNAQPYVGAEDYGNAFSQITAQPPAPTPAQTRKFRRGDQEVTQEFDPATGGWNDISVGNAFKTTPDVVVSNSGEPSDAGLRKKLSDKEGETWNNYQNGAAVSGGMVQDLQVLDELSKIAPQGPVTGRLVQMFPGVSSAGAAYQSIVSRVAPSLRAPGSGSTSDVEYEGFLRSLPSLQNTPEGNAVISAILQRKAEINIRRGEIVDRYQNGEINAVEARKQLGALNRQSILDPQVKALIAATGGGEATVDDVLKKYPPQQ